MTDCVHRLAWLSVLLFAWLVARLPADEAPSTTDDELHAVRFTGRVIDDRGQVAPHVEVRMQTVDASKSRPGETSGNITLATAQANDRGEFTLTLPTSWRQRVFMLRQDLTLLAVRGDARGTLTFSRQSVPAEHGTTVILRREGTTTLTIVTPTGAPLSDAEVRVVGHMCDGVYNGVTQETIRERSKTLGINSVSTPFGFVFPASNLTVFDHADCPVGRTNVQGAVTFEGLDSVRVAIVEVTHAEFGTQLIGYLNSSREQWAKDWPAVIRLSPTRKLTIHTHAPDDTRLAGTPVYASVNLYDQQSGLARITTARGQLDEQGTVTLPALSDGPAQVFFDVPDTLHLRPNLSVPIVIQGDAPTVVDVMFRRPTLVHGRIADELTGRGLANVRVLTFVDQRIQTFSSDDQGMFRFEALPGQISLTLDAQPGYAPDIKDSVPGNSVLATIPDESEVTLKEIRLSPLGNVSGRISDDEGQPISAAQVTGTWSATSPRFGQRRDYRATTTTDAQGRFTLPGVPASADLQVTASAQERTQTTAFRAADWFGHELSVPLHRDPRRPLHGRVLDDSGQPLVGAEVTIDSRDRRGRSASERAAANDSAASPLTAITAITDQAGEFSSAPLPPEGEYRLIARASRYLTAASPWFDVTKPGGFDAQTITLRRVRGVLWRWLDHQGQPVANAQVTRWTATEVMQTITDVQGQCELPAAPANGCLVLVSHPEFRFHGERCVAASDPVVRVLTRRSETSTSTALTTRWPFSQQVRQQLARDLVEPLIQRLDQPETTPAERMAWVEAVASARPEWVDAYLATHSAVDEQQASMLRRVAFQCTNDADPTTYLERMTDDYVRIIASLDVLPRLATTEDKLELLASMAVRARGIQQPEFRVLGLALVAKQLLQLERRDDAVALLQEAKATADQLPNSAYGGYVRGVLATELSPVDPAAALAMIAALTDDAEHARHHGNVAVRLAASHPELAEQAFAQIRAVQPPRADNRGLDLSRIVYRMAPADLPRADRLVSSIDDPLARAYALGATAAGLIESQPEEATRRFAAAFDQLTDADDLGPTARPELIQASAVVVSLLPYIERLDGQLAHEYFWRSLTLLPIEPGNRADPVETYRYRQSLLSLTLLAVRYDPEVAGLLEPLLLPPGFDAQDDDARVVRYLINPERERARWPTPLQPFSIRTLVLTLTHRDNDFWNCQYRITRTLRFTQEDLGDE